MTAPTRAPGEVSPVPRRARSWAWRMKVSSCSENVMVTIMDMLELCREKRVCKILRTERQQIASLLAYANVADGQAKFARDSHHNSSFGRAIELGQHNPSPAGRFRKQPRLLQAILTGGGVHYQQDFMRRSRNDAIGGALHLFQFSHQAGLGMQAAGGVNNYAVSVARLGGTERVKQYRGGIASGLGLDDFYTGARTPDFKLLNCRGAKSI